MLQTDEVNALILMMKYTILYILHVVYSYYRIEIHKS